MPLRTGLASQLTAPVAETTYGVVPAGLATTTKFSAFKSETLKLTKNKVQGEGLLAGKLYPQGARRVVTDWSAGGGITMDLPARGLQQWLFPMLGSYGTTASALTQDGTTGAYKAVHAPGPLEGNSFCLQKGVPVTDTGAVLPVTYIGAKCIDWTLSVAVRQIAQLVLTIDARNELAGLTPGNSDPLNPYPIPGLVPYVSPIGGVFHFKQATLFSGGVPSTVSGVTTVSGATAVGNVLSAQIKHAVPIDGQRLFLGSAGFKGEQLQNALRMPTGQFVIEWVSSQAQYSAYSSDTPTSLQLQFLGPAIGTGADFSTLTILLSNIYLDDAPISVAGAGVVQQTVPFTGLDDGVNNVIQATYWTLDSS